MVASITGMPLNSSNRMSGWFEIDQSPCRASYGMKSTSAWSLELSAQGKQQAMATIARIASQGDRMANIASGENAIVNIAVENSLPKETGQLVWSPIDRPLIDYHPSARFIVDI